MLEKETIIEELEAQIEDVREKKNQAVRNQQYEKAADLRDSESKLVKKLEQAKEEWEEESKTRRYPVGEEEIAEVEEDNELNELK